MTSPTIKAQRRIIYLGDIALEVAMLPDGNYCLSQTQVSAVVEKPESSIRSFRQSKRAKALLQEDLQFATLAIEGASKPIAPVTLELAALYWYKYAYEGNTKARSLIIALLKRSLYGIADEAFGIKRPLSDRSRILTEDLSDRGVARIEVMHQNLEPQTFFPESETETKQELELKIRLAELELEQEKLKRSRSNNTFPATDISRIGVPPWQVIPWAQQTLGWACFPDAARLLTKLGYGYKTRQEFKLRISGEVWIMPPDSFNSLKTALEQFKSSCS